MPSSGAGVIDASSSIKASSYRRACARAIERSCTRKSTLGHAQAFLKCFVVKDLSIIINVSKEFMVKLAFKSLAGQERNYRLAYEFRLSCLHYRINFGRWTFFSDALTNNRKFRCLNIVDDCTKENLAIHVARSIRSVNVVEVLEAIAKERGYPAAIRVDNGPEFIALALDIWAFTHKVKLQFIEPGKPRRRSNYGDLITTR